MPLVCAHCERPPRKGTKLDGRGYCGNAACRAVSASAAAVASKSQSTLAGFLSPSMRQPTEAGTAKSPPQSGGAWRFKQVQQRHFRATSIAVDNEESKRAKLPFLANPEEVGEAGSSAEEQEEAARNVAAARSSSSSSSR